MLNTNSIKRIRPLLIAIAASSIVSFANAQERQPDLIESGVAGSRPAQQLGSEAMMHLEAVERRNALNLANLKAAQAYERVGKQIYPAQPTGRTVLQRTDASPWLERFISRRDEGQATGPQAAHLPTQNLTPQTAVQPIAGTQSRYQGKQLRGTHPANERNFAPDRSASQDTPRAPTSQARSQPQPIRVPTAQRAQPTPQAVSRQRQVPQPLRSGFAAPTAQTPLSTPRSTTRSTAPSAPSATVDRSTTALNEGSSRTSISNTPQRLRPSAGQPTTNTAELPTSQPPKVSRVPLPSTSRSFEKLATEASRAKTQDSTKQDSATTKPTAEAAKQDVAASKPVAAKTADNAAVSNNALNRPAKVAAPPQGSSVSVPTRLVNTPLAESAAKRESETPPTGMPFLNQNRPTPQIAEKTKSSASKQAVSEVAKPSTSPTSGPSLTTNESLGSNQSTVPEQSSLPSANLPIASMPSKDESLELPPLQLPSTASVRSEAGLQFELPPADARIATSKMSPPTTASPQTNLSNTISSQPPVSQTTLPTTQSKPALARLSNQMADAIPTTERMRMTTPRVQVTLNGPSNVPVGSAANYEVNVKNDDQVDLSGLILRMDVPAGVTVQPATPSRGEFDSEIAPDGATLVTWGFEKLAAGETAIAPIKMIARSAKDFSIAMDWTLMPLNETANVHVVSPKIEIALEGPSDVQFGAKNTYKLRLKNTGEALAKNVVVKLDAAKFGSSETQIGNMAPGAQESVEVELQFEQRGRIGIAAVATANGNLNSQTNLDIFVRRPQLVANIDAPQLIYHGSATSYTVRVNNTGDAPAKNVIGKIAIPSGAKPVELPYGATISGQTLSWPITEIRAGATEQFAFQFNLTNEGANAVRFQCADSFGNEAECAATTVVESIVDLKLTVSDPVAPAPVGAEVIYELSLTNRGSKAANNVSVIAQFSQGVEPTRGVGQGYRVVPGQLFFDPIADIAAGETVKLRVYAMAAEEGSHRFRAEVRADQAETRLVHEESTRYLNSGNAQIASPSGASTLR